MVVSRKGLRELLLEQGFDNVIVKFIDCEVLSEILSQYLYIILM